MKKSQRQRIETYRNCKIQRNTFKNQKDNFCMMLNADLMFVLGKLDEENMFEGPAFIQYLNGFTFFGHISQGQPDKLSIFRIKKQYIIYYQSDPQKYLIQLQQSNVLLQIKYEALAQTQQITIFDSHEYKSQKQKQQYLKNYFPQHSIFDQELFLQTNFQNCFESSSIELENKTITLSSNDHSSLIITLRPNFYSVVSKVQNVTEFYFQKTQNTIHQQLLMNQKIFFFDYKTNNRPTNARLFLLDHFKSSLQFIDKFILTDYLFLIQKYFLTMRDKMIFLQIPKHQQNETADFVIPIQIVKESIYRAVKQKRTSNNGYVNDNYSSRSVDRKENLRDNRISPLMNTSKYQLTQEKKYQKPQTNFNHYRFTKKRENQMSPYYRFQKTDTLELSKKRKESIQRRSQTTSQLYKELQSLQRKSQKKNKVNALQQSRLRVDKKEFELNKKEEPVKTKQLYEKTMDIKELTACYEIIVNKIKKEGVGKNHYEEVNKSRVKQKQKKGLYQDTEVKNRRPFII